MRAVNCIDCFNHRPWRDPASRVRVLRLTQRLDDYLRCGVPISSDPPAPDVQLATDSPSPMGVRVVLCAACVGVLAEESK